MYVKLRASDITGRSQIQKSPIRPSPCVGVDIGAWETHLIDSRDPGPILHGLMSLELLKLEGRSGRGFGTAPLTPPLAKAAHRRTAQTVLGTQQTSCGWIHYTGSGVPEWGG